MILAMTVLLWHLLYDFHWQGPYVAEMKAKEPCILAVHAVTWALGLTVILYYFGVRDVRELLLAYTWFSATHYIIDWGKCSLTKIHGQRMKDLYVDQCLHLFTMALPVALLLMR